MRIFILVIGLSLFLAGACHQPKEDNSFSFRPDSTKVYHVVKTKEVAQDWVYNDKPQHSNHYSETAFRLKVQNVLDSSLVLRLSFDRFLIKDRKTDTDLPIPTAKEVEEDPMKLYDYLFHFAKGLSVYVTIDIHGLVKNVQGVAGLLDSITNMSGRDRSIVRAYLRDIISKEAIQDELNELFCFLPARPKQTGQSWVTDVVYSSKAPLQWSNMYVLDSLQRDTAHLTVSTTVSARQGDKVYMKGKLAGNIIAGYSTGIPFSYHLTGETVTKTDVYDITTKTSIKLVIGE